jgi:SAM-dependent methyltransferase
MMLDDGYFDRFQTRKYRSRNRLQRLLIRRFAGRIHELFARAQPVRSVLEVGVGEGFLSGFLSERYPEVAFTGVDLDPTDLDNLRRKFPRIDARQGSAYELAGLGRFELVLCAEVLEHLERPGDALAQIAAVEPRYALFSVPHEPWFMASNFLRGKNVSRWGDDVDHLNHWGPEGLRRLLAPRFELVAMERSFPWLLALTRPREASAR